MLIAVSAIYSCLGPRYNRIDTLREETPIGGHEVFLVKTKTQTVKDEGNGYLTEAVIHMETPVFSVAYDIC